MDDDDMVYVSIMTCPRDDLPVKEWQVEIEPGKTIGDLKQLVHEEYSVKPELQKFCLNNNRVDPGIKDHTQVCDLPAAGDQADVKKVYLLPNRGKDKPLLDCILDWAFRAECLEEYEARGCVYDPEDIEQPVASGRRGSRFGRLSILGASQMTIGRASMRPTRRTQAKPVIKHDGDKLTVEDPTPALSDGMPFNFLCSVICAINCLVVGLEADYTCWGLEECKTGDRFNWYLIDCIIAVCFVIEVAIRIRDQGGIWYFRGDEITNQLGFSIVNTGDFFVVLFRFIEIFFDNAGIDTKIRVISCIRIAHFARVAKLLRLIRTVRELWLIVAGIGDLLKTVAWVMILLVMIFWIVGIIMVIIVGHSEEDFDYSRSYWGKSEYFDTVPKAMYSMFQTMTLSQWSSVMFRPIFEQYPAIFVLLVPFLCITTVGLLNIIVGVVVETTLTSASNNAEKEHKEMQKMHAKVMESLKMVFEEADTDGGGTIDRDELKKILKKSHCRDRLKVLDIPIKDLEQLFDVLDEEKLGEINTTHFFRGCSRLRGPALACDLHRMSVDFSRYITWTDKIVTDTQSTNERLRSLLRDMESVDRDIIKGEHDECDPVLGNRRDRSMKKESQEQAARGEGVLCTTCGSLFVGGAQYCKQCGSRRPLTSSTTGNNHEPDQRAPTKNSNTSKSSRRGSLMSRTLTTQF